jgi:hypothetical protein
MTAPEMPDERYVGELIRERIRSLSAIEVAVAIGPTFTSTEAARKWTLEQLAEKRIPEPIDPSRQKNLRWAPGVIALVLEGEWSAAAARKVEIAQVRNAMRSA